MTSLIFFGFGKLKYDYMFRQFSIKEHVRILTIDSLTTAALVPGICRHYTSTTCDLINYVNTRTGVLGLSFHLKRIYYSYGACRRFLIFSQQENIVV